LNPVNLNRVILIGRLTQEPETRSTAGGQSVTTLSMATNRAWTNQSGQKQEASEFHRVVAWGRLGEIANQYLKKGGLLMIEGRLQTRSWTDKTNNKRYTTEIVAESLQLGPRTAGSSEFSRPPAVMADVKKVAPKDDDIPIIDENEPVSRGVEEDEINISEKDLPF